MTGPVNISVRRYDSTDPAAPTLVLAHGAGAGHDHPWMRRAGDGLAARGVQVVTFNFPYVQAGRRVPDRAPVLEAAWGEMWTSAGGLFAGGKSMGGRIASQAAAKGVLTPPPAGLVYFGYPLHPPGKPEDRRDRHLPAIGRPMLFVHGTRDPFGTPDEMRALVTSLGDHCRLELIDGGDHSFARALDRALDLAASWMLEEHRRAASAG